MSDVLTTPMFVTVVYLYLHAHWDVYVSFCACIYTNKC